MAEGADEQKEGRGGHPLDHSMRLPSAPFASFVATAASHCRIVTCGSFFRGFLPLCSPGTIIIRRECKRRQGKARKRREPATQGLSSLSVRCVEGVGVVCRRNYLVPRDFTLSRGEITL